MDRDIGKKTVTGLWKKMETDMAKLIPPEEVEKSNTGNSCFEAIKLLGDATKNMGQIIITNADRSGVLSNLTLRECRAVKKLGDHWVISVREHKTASRYNPAKLVVEASVLGRLDQYVATDQSPLFISWTGQKLKSGQVSRSIQSAWMKARLGRDINSPDIFLVRKSGVSPVHQANPEEKDNLSDLMGQTVSTASHCSHCRAGAHQCAGTQGPFKGTGQQPAL